MIYLYTKINKNTNHFIYICQLFCICIILDRKMIDEQPKGCTHRILIWMGIQMIFFNHFLLPWNACKAELLH